MPNVTLNDRRQDGTELFVTLELNETYFDAILTARPREVIEFEGTLIEGSETNPSNPNSILIKDHYAELLGDEVNLRDISIVRVGEDELEDLSDELKYCSIGTRFTVRGTRI